MTAPKESKLRLLGTSQNFPSVPSRARRASGKQPLPGHPSIPPFLSFLQNDKENRTPCPHLPCVYTPGKNNFIMVSVRPRNRKGRSCVWVCLRSGPGHRTLKWSGRMEGACPVPTPKLKALSAGRGHLLPPFPSPWVLGLLWSLPWHVWPMGSPSTDVKLCGDNRTVLDTESSSAQTWGLLLVLAKQLRGQGFQQPVWLSCTIILGQDQPS